MEFTLLNDTIRCDYPDVIFLLSNGKKLPASKIIIANRSEPLKMFLDRAPTQKEFVIDKDPELFTIMIQAMYGKKFTLSSEQIVTLIPILHYYQVDHPSFVDYIDFSIEVLSQLDLYLSFDEKTALISKNLERVDFTELSPELQKSYFYEILALDSDQLIVFSILGRKVLCTLPNNFLVQFILPYKDDIILGGYRTSICILSQGTVKQIELDQSNDELYHLKVSHDKLFAVLEDRLQIHDFSGKLLHTFPQRGISWMDIEDTTLAYYHGDTVYIYDIKNNTEIARFPFANLTRLEIHQNILFCILENRLMIRELSADGHYTLLSHDVRDYVVHDRHILIQNTDRQIWLKSMNDRRLFEKICDNLDDAPFTFGRHGKDLVIVNPEGPEIKVIELASGKQIQCYDGISRDVIVIRE